MFVFTDRLKLLIFLENVRVRYRSPDKVQYVIFWSRKVKKGCRDLANERAPKNESANHVSIRSILSRFLFSIN
jgi:hypothetical protein